MSKYIFFAIILSVLFACNQKEVKIPQDVIQPEIMAQIFRDIHLTDAYITRKKLKINTNYIKVNGYYKSIYEKYGFDRATFDSSLIFYTKNPFVLDALYEDVITELSKMVDTVSRKE